MSDGNKVQITKLLPAKIWAQINPFYYVRRSIEFGRRRSVFERPTLMSGVSHRVGKHEEFLQQRGCFLLTAASA